MIKRSLVPAFNVAMGNDEIYVSKVTAPRKLKNGLVVTQIECEVDPIAVKEAFADLRDLTDEEIRADDSLGMVLLKLSFTDISQTNDDFNFDDRAHLRSLTVYESGWAFNSYYLVVKEAHFERTDEGGEVTETTVYGERG